MTLRDRLPIDPPPEEVARIVWSAGAPDALAWGVVIFGTLLAVASLYTLREVLARPK